MNVDTNYFMFNASNQLSTMLLLKGYDKLLTIDSTTKTIKSNVDTNYLMFNASNQLSTTLLLKGVKASNSLSIDATTKL